MSSRKKLGRRGPSDSGVTTFREGFRRQPPEKRPPGFRRATKRWKLEDLYREVRDTLLAFKAAPKRSYWHAFTLEELADRFRAKTHLVHQCVHRLIREGIGLVELNRGGPHDTRRDYSFCSRKHPIGPDVDLSHWPNGWMATQYYFRESDT